MAQGGWRGKRQTRKINGVSEGVRTLDTWSHNPVLYRLSYTHHEKGVQFSQGTDGLSTFNSPPADSKVARQGGLEPPTDGLEGRCSVQLSYWRFYGRGERIRTSDPLCPRQVRYQAALRPDKGGFISTARVGMQSKSADCHLTTPRPIHIMQPSRAEVVEQVDTSVSKTDAFRACRFESGLRYQGFKRAAISDGCGSRLIRGRVFSANKWHCMIIA